VLDGGGQEPAPRRRGAEGDGGRTRGGERDVREGGGRMTSFAGGRVSGAVQ
jgi:hypothetical protein